MNFSVEFDGGDYVLNFRFTPMVVEVTVKRGKQTKNYLIGQDGTTVPNDWRAFDLVEDDDLEREDPLRYKVDCWINAVNSPFEPDQDPIINNETVLMTFTNAITDLFQSRESYDLEFLQTHPKIDEDMGYFA